MDIISPKKALLTALVSSLLGSIFVFARVRQVLPTVFGDELVYFKMSSGYPESDYLGNALFNSIMGFVVDSGLDFYTQVKVVNVFLLFTFGVAVGVYASKRVPPLIVAFLTLAAVVGPASVYSSFFMPEVLFFSLLSWGLVFLDVGLRSLSPMRALSMFTMAAIVVGLSSLSKPHALLLLPLMFVLILWISGLLLKLRIAVAAGFVILVTAVNIVLTQLLAPGQAPLFAGYAPRGLDSIFGIISSVFGSGPAAPSDGDSVPAGETGSTNSLFETIIALGPGYGLILTVAIGVPVAVLIILPGRKRIDFLGLSIVIWLAVAILGFSYYLTVSGDDHSDRLLLRYFEWAFIFVIVDSSSKLFRVREIGDQQSRVLSGAALAQIAGVILYSGLNIDTQVSDSIFASGLALNLDSPWFVGLVSLSVAYVFIRFRGNAFKLVPLFGAVMYIALGVSAQQYQINVNSTLVSSDLAGIYLYETYQGSLADPLLVVGSDQTLNQSAIFWSREFDAELQITSPSREINVSESDKDQLVLTLDGITLRQSEYVRTLYSAETFNLYRVFQIP